MEEESKGIGVVKILKKVMGVIKQRMEIHFKEMNLTSPQGMMMGTLNHYGEMKVRDLSEKLGLSNSTVSGIIDRLENQGLVERTRSKEDRRVVYIKLTDKCKEYSRKPLEEINTLFEETLDRATSEELDIIFKGLNTLEAVMERRKE